MANVEVQLDVKAEYKQALTAIAMLGKALDAVQQRAKVALSVAGGAQGSGQDSAGAGKAEAEQKAAVEALSAAMKDAAGAAATLAESVAKLTPALEAMGPQAEQVQQVLTLAEHYKQLANAMGVAADAAAKYNASGAQQGETDTRIQKLMEENQKLMELVSNIRAEYAEIVKRNAELNRTKTAREESARSAREELEAEQDLSYQMALSVMSKRELIAEIKRLTKEREEAAKVKDQKLWEEKTEELKLARQALTKLRQEQQLSRIAWMQQAQTAQQMGQSVRTLADGFLNFGESIENGTVNLTGMVSAVTSLSLAIKAGLGPLGWALAAVELLTTAWNMYAKSQKEAEEAEKKRQERIAKLTTAYHEAAAEAQKFKDQEARKAEINELIARYETLNDRLRDRNALQDENLRMKQAELLMNTKEEDMEMSVERNEIMRAYWRGEIDEEERESRLEKLKIKQAKNKKKQVQEQGKLALTTVDEKTKIAEERIAAADIELGRLLGNDEAYKEDPEEMEKRAAAYVSLSSNINQQLHAIEAKERELEDFKNSFMARVWLSDQTGQGQKAYKAEVKKYQDEIDKMQSVAKTLQEGLIRRQEELLGWDVDALQDGEYAEKYKHQKELLKKAKDESQKASAEKLKLLDERDKIERENAIAEAKAEQEYRHSIRRAGEAQKNRQTQKEYKERKQAEEQAKRAAEEAAEAARREAQRRAKLQSAALDEGEYEGNLTKQARAIANGKGYKMLADNRLSEAELKTLVDVAQNNAENEALLALIRDILKTAQTNKNVTARKLGEFRKQLEKANINNID